MDLKDVAQCMQEETRTKWHQEYDAGNGIWSRMEDQLQWLIKVVTESSEAVTQEIQESNHAKFGAVRSNLEYIFDIVSRKPSAQPLL